jgi:CheY-like chemotaxis protein
VANAKILIVEDEGIVAIDIKRRLKRLGYEVPAIASSGKEAIRQAIETQPDLVMMDIMLKGEMDGIQAAQHILDLLATPVVYLTAHADDLTILRAKRTNPFAYIVKPFDDLELQRVIMKCVGASDLQKSGDNNA